MKYSIGYQMMPSLDFVEALLTYRDKISEVYFSWGNFPNGRNSQIRQSHFSAWEAQKRQEEDLQKLAEGGLKFNLLFNAMCYGKDSQSRAFFDDVGRTIDYIKRTYGLSSVTTTSPLIAKFVKTNFKTIEVRASVNMEIGSIEGMEYVKEYFDSFYMKRELNRNFYAIHKLKEWCEQNGKTLYALANSGCLNDCSAHIFHDNLVAHEQEISQMDNGYEFMGVCRKYLEDPKNHKAILTQTGFIRPEDVHYFEGLFPAMKLATRVSKIPIQVLKAYINEEYKGNTLDLLEPNHAGALYPYFLDNRRIISNVKEGRLIYSNFETALINLDLFAVRG